MPPLARTIVPERPHHVTARGARRGPIFFEDGDQAVCLDLFAEQTRKAGVEVWSWCLMPNPVPLILHPQDETGPRRRRDAPAPHQRHQGLWAMDGSSVLRSGSALG